MKQKRFLIKYVWREEKTVFLQGRERVVPAGFYPMIYYKFNWYFTNTTRAEELLYYKEAFLLPSQKMSK